MKISKEARRHARELLKGSLADGRLDARRIAEYADRLIAEKPRSYLAVLKEFTRLVRLEIYRRHAVIESAAPLDPAAAARLEDDLRQRFGADLAIETRTNPALLGGLRVQVGSDVWDGSVSNRLQLLQQQL
ncbi:MAG: F0F1 ATP synthase subunit delta [Terrimicrobiaceae bacterium]|nr:F0F1 ATP synthase subunit delta [Terrimicrobiaceae bacterium]